MDRLKRFVVLPMLVLIGAILPVIGVVSAITLLHRGDAGAGMVVVVFTAVNTMLCVMGVPDVRERILRT